MNHKQMFRLKKLAATLLLLTLLLGMVTLVMATPAPGSTPGSAPGNSNAVDGITTVDLRPQWAEGQSARYEFWNQMEQTSHVKLDDKSQTTASTIEVEGEVTWTVDRVNADGSSVNTMTLDWMKYASTPTKGEAVTVDSRKSATPATKLMHELLSAMAKVRLTVEVAADGHVTNIKGLDQMKAKTSQPEFIPSALDFEETASDLAAIAYAPSPIAYTAGQGNPKPWKADFRWEHDLGKMDQRWDYTLDRVENIAGVPVAVVTGKGQFKLDPDVSDDRPADAPPVNVKLLEGTATSEVLFDLSRHEAVGRHSTGREKVQVTVSFPDGRRFVRTLTEETVGQVIRLSED